MTWNMAYWSHRASHDKAWEWLLEKIQPDIILSQECVPPNWIGKEWIVLWDKAFPNGKQPWGTAILTRLPSSSTRLPELDLWLTALPKLAPGKNELSAIHRIDGWITTAEINIPFIGPSLVVSVHNPSYPIELERLEGIDISAMKLKKNKDLWLLDVLFYFLRNRDFNYSRLLDDLYGERGNHEFFDRIGKEGFVSLHRIFHDADEQTFFKKGGMKHQLDYLYTDGSIAKHAVSCKVIPFSQVAEFSDHAPLVADLRPD